MYVFPISVLRKCQEIRIIILFFKRHIAVIAHKYCLSL